MEGTLNETGRRAPIEMAPDEFRALGHRLVDTIADFMGTMPSGKVATGESPAQVRAALDSSKGLPQQGSEPGGLLDEASRFLFDHSLFIGHPRFMGFITSSPAPIGALADLLASSVNPNLGGWPLSPAATEIEAQTVRWIAELLGYPTDCGGLLVSGGNMANFVGFLAARRAKAPWDVRSAGAISPEGKRLCVYTSAETHTWVQKAADLFGLGTDAIRWIATDSRQRMEVGALRKAIETDRAKGEVPFLVVGTAGSVSTGAVDPLPALSAVCKEYGLWFHVDGAYGGFAAALPEELGCPPDLKGLSLADSVAIDPHKWLYAPLEAGCALVRDREVLRDTFSFHPPYYYMQEHAEEPEINYHEYGPQNSRGFRALKVWLALQQVGREGYVRMMADDIALAQRMSEFVREEADLEAFTSDLSIATFRYVPPDLDHGTDETEAYLNKLNAALVERIGTSGELFISNAVIDGKFLLRACIVNFRTSLADVRALPEIVLRLGRETDRDLRGAGL
ncbi:MAG TPA: aspartate aminotransferase family protein [Chloroflexia bacterium]|nr:aspartate aminotransferase family protein [Chloroflexia bacterium]